MVCFAVSRLEMFKIISVFGLLIWFFFSLYIRNNVISARSPFQINNSSTTCWLCVCLVLTSCASLPTTPTRSCTRCWSWPSARAVRVLACSDSSINWHCGFTHTRDQHCSTALVSCIRSHLTGGLVGTLTLPNKYPLSRWASVSGSPRRL